MTRSGKRSQLASGRRRASSTLFSNGAIRTASPWSTSTGATIASTGVICAANRDVRATPSECFGRIVGQLLDRVRAGGFGDRP